MIVGELSVAENVFLGSEPGLGGILYSRRQAERRTAEVLRRLAGDLDIDPAWPAGRLSTAQKQIVEIARALVRRAPVLIMDEPTAALSDKEAAALLRIMRQLRDRRRGDRVHLAPARRGPRHRRPDHGPARRREDRDARSVRGGGHP